MSGSALPTNEEQKRETNSSYANESGSLRWGVYLLVVAGALFLVHGVGFLYRTFYTPGFELGVHTLDGVTAPELASTNPEVASYINHVHVSFSGLMIAAGIGVIALAWYGVRRHQRWSLATVLLIPLVFLAFTIPVHQTVTFDFHTLQHLGPAAIGTPILLVGAVLAYHGQRPTRKPITGEA